MRNTNRERKPPPSTTNLSQTRGQKVDNNDSNSILKGKSKVQKNKGSDNSSKPNTPNISKSERGTQMKADVTKSDIRRSQARKRAQQKHNKARAMKKMGI